MKPTEISYYTKCDCSCHTLEIERYKYDNVDKGFNLTIWVREGHQRIMNWKERFRWIKHILIHGHLWADTVIITDEKAKNLCKFVQEQLKSD